MMRNTHYKELVLELQGERTTRQSWLRMAGDWEHGGSLLEQQQVLELA
jgi:hypothetical protein